YFNTETNAMMTGRLIINNVKYYFNENGTMRRGWAKLEDGHKYYFDVEGKMVTGWYEIKEKLYYFNPSNGQLVTNTIMGDYNLTNDGSAVPLSAVQQRAKSVILSMGAVTPTSIYNYVCSHNTYRYMEDTRSLDSINSTGWAYFADYALTNRYVVCYYFAAVSDLLFKQAGYTSRIVYGTGRGAGDHYWNQVYVNGSWTNYDACNGYADVSFSFLQSQNYTFYQYVNPIYY
ncbi:MAG: hypothetical protein K2N49_01800, partial [Ruminococcus sp.]|nr:hypothetical protein [Ruminococcus sp.]